MNIWTLVAAHRNGRRQVLAQVERAGPEAPSAWRWRSNFPQPREGTAPTHDDARILAELALRGEAVR